MRSEDRYLFVGERPSATAQLRRWRWQDGHLAARTLFAALRYCDIDPATQRYLNLFGRQAEGPYRVSAAALRTVRLSAAAGFTVVALGQRVSGVLAAEGIAHVQFVHPAARGRIRRRDAYHRHVRAVLFEEAS